MHQKFVLIEGPHVIQAETVGTVAAHGPVPDRQHGRRQPVGLVAANAASGFCSLAPKAWWRTCHRRAPASRGMEGGVSQGRSMSFCAMTEEAMALMKARNRASIGAKPNPATGRQI
jgi:hypothetical protein